jgi:murein hydrolase activator
MRAFVRLLILLLLTLPVIEGGAQSKSDLEKRKKQLQREIEETNRQLKATSKNKKKTSAELEKLRQKIKLRQQLIGTINTEQDGPAQR